MNNKEIHSLAVNGNNIFAGTSDYGVYLSTNNGTTWTQTALCSNSYGFIVYSLAVSGNNIFAGTSYTYPVVFISTNNGNNLDANFWKLNVRSLAVSGNNIFAGTEFYGVWLSTNNGITWTQSGLDSLWVVSLAVSGNNILAGTEFYGVWLSTNNGSNWSHIGLNNRSVWSLAIHGNNIFAGTTDYGVYLSTNNGTNWTQTALNNRSINSLAVSGNKIFAGTYQYGFYFSSDNGNNWIQFNQGFNVVPTIGALLVANDYVYTGTEYYSVWRCSLSNIGIKNISSNIPVQFSLSQNYPNPFNPFTNIKFISKSHQM